MDTQLKNQHLLWRAGFGPAVEQLGDLSKTATHKLYKALVKASAKKPVYLETADDYLKGLFQGAAEVGRMEKLKDMSADERKEIQKRNRDGIKNLNLYWIKEMVNSEAQFREKMAFFWHGHFACRNLNIFYQQGLLDILRQHALGNFGEMLHEVSKSAAMLNFLNNNQNRKDHPNENFAREVMELFTLGRGNYKEEDIKEAARAFTGWGANVQGDFVFRKNQHDAGSKTVLGKTGNFDGDEVLDILLENKQTAKFIAQKMYKFFVNDKVDDTKIQWLADRFYKNNYDISKLAEDIFTSDWFYDEKNIGVKIKSPVELITGIQRMLPMKFENEEALLLVQRVLGQMLFYPPNVAGWPGGKTWIDSSTLMMRMRIPQLISAKDDFNIRPKDDDDQMMGRMDKSDAPKAYKKFGKGGGKPIDVTIDWKSYLEFYDKVPRTELLNEIAGTILQTSKTVNADVINKYADAGSRDAFVKSVTIQLMSTPEYQLC